VIRALPPTRRLARLVRTLFDSDPSAHKAAGAGAGARLAAQPWVDDQVGPTVPPGVAGIEADAVSEAAPVAAAFERDQGVQRARLRRRGSVLVARRERLAALAVSEPVDEEPVEPGDTRRVALLWWAWLVGLCGASAGLDAVVLYVLGMDSITTWGIAAFAGTAQVVALVDVGGRLRDRHDADGKPEGPHLMVVGVAAAVAFGIAAAALRSSRMAAEAAVVHVPAPSFLLGLLTFTALALVIDGVALLLGYRLAGRKIRAQLVAARQRTSHSRNLRWATWRTEKARGRFLAAAERARSQLEVWTEAITTVLAHHEAALAAYYDAACGGVDAPAGAALADQFGDRQQLAEAERARWAIRIEEARWQLVGLITSYGEELIIETPEPVPVYLVEGGKEDVGGVEAA